MRIAFTKNLIFFCSIFLLLVNCRKPERVNGYCPYAIGDHLEYSNNWQINYTNGQQEKSKVFIIYEVLDIEEDEKSSVIKMKRYYSDVNGTVEDSIFNIYTDKKVYLIRPDQSRDSLAFTLGDNQIRTLEDLTDSSGMRQVTKLADNNASVSNSKGLKFDGCLKITSSMYDLNSSEYEFVFEKTSYYKETVLVKYSSIDRRQEENGVKEIQAESELDEFNIFAWR